MKLIQKLTLFQFWLLLLPVAPAFSGQYENCSDDLVRLDTGDYLAGFVKDKNNIGLMGATIVITDDRNKLFSLKSDQYGWFETYSPLSKNSDPLNLFVIKRGYQPSKIKIIRQLESDKCLKGGDAKVTNSLNINMVPIPDYYVEVENINYQSNVIFGYVDDKLGNPINGGVITLKEDTKKGVLPRGSAVTRESGYFSLYYEDGNRSTERKYRYSIEHYKHDTKEKEITLNSRVVFVEEQLDQMTYGFSLGAALQFQTTGTQSDNESGGALLLNLSWYPDKLTVVDKYFPRPKKSGTLGYDLSIGVVPFQETSVGSDEVGNIVVVGLGVSFTVKGFYLPFRVGITASDTDEVAAYFGVNIPLYYFGAD